MKTNLVLNRTEETHSKRNIPLWNRAIGLRAWLLVSIAFVFYAVRMFRLISRYAVNVFFADQWDFNDVTFFQRHSLWQMFDRQHGPHRQGVGALFERMVDPLFGWNSRTESFVVGGVIVAAGLCAMWLRRRLYGELSVFDVVIPAILFIPGQWATWFMTANFAHGPFPLLLILLYCVSWTSGRRSVRYPLVLFINFVTIYTGFGIFLGVITPLLLILDYWASAPETRLPKTYFAGTIVVALASLGSFFLGYKLLPGLPCFSLQPQSPTSYLAFVPHMFANFFGLKHLTLSTRTIGTMILTAVLISLVMVAWQLLRQNGPKLERDDRNRALIVVGLTAYTLLFCVNTAYGRQCGGLNIATASRYVIYLEPAVLGFYFFLLSLRDAAPRKFLLSGFVVAVVAASFYLDTGGMGFAKTVKQGWKDCYLKTENIQECDKVAGFPNYENAEATHLQEKLEYLKKTRQNLYLDQQRP
ncbi:MAG: hypothetical protein JWN74_445 [Acidobacteriaceae bacterium]|nr:hypothetical protein [Acidobacteriaceae bacterium]